MKRLNGLAVGIAFALIAGSASAGVPRAPAAKFSSCCVRYQGSMPEIFGARMP